MQIENIITKDDLTEPYIQLSEILSLSEIINLEKLYRGQQIRFRKTYSDIETYQPELAALLGKEKSIKVIKRFGGLWVYFPELKRSCLDKIKTLIISEFNGYNTFQLAKKFGYTERHIKNIVSGSSKRNMPYENQITLFDMPL